MKSIKLQELGFPDVFLHKHHLLVRVTGGREVLLDVLRHGAYALILSVFRGFLDTRRFLDTGRLLWFRRLLLNLSIVVIVILGNDDKWKIPKVTSPIHYVGILTGD